MQEHERWLQIAREDLLAAKGLIKLELFSSAVYHCQQTAEKSLKGYLAFKKYPITKTHDLIRLLEVCMTFDHAFSKKFDAVDYINPFATRFRYPTEFDIPTHADANVAVKHAATVLKFVLQKISVIETGQTSIDLVSKGEL